MSVLLLVGCNGGADGNDANDALSALDERLADQSAKTKVAADADRAVSVERKAADPSHAKSAAAVDRLRVASGRTVDACGRDVRTGPDWAKRMPAAFAVYPGARLTEAAGVTNGRCHLAVVSFVANVSPARIAAHYRDTARADGFDAELQPCENEDRLGGTRIRDGAAYVVFIRGTKGGRSSTVDIVATIA